MQNGAQSAQELIDPDSQTKLHLDKMSGDDVTCKKCPHGALSIGEDNNNIMYSRACSALLSLSEFKDRDQGHHVCKKRGERRGRNGWGWMGVGDRAVLLTFLFFHADNIVVVAVMEGRGKKGKYFFDGMIGRKKEHSVWHKTMKRGEKDVEKVANGAKEKRKGESTSNWHSNHVQRSGLELVVCLVGGQQRNKKSERKIEAVKGEWTSHFSVERKKTRGEITAGI